MGHIRHISSLGLVLFVLSSLLLTFSNCSNQDGDKSAETTLIQNEPDVTELATGLALKLNFSRVSLPGLDAFDVRVRVTSSGTPTPGKTLVLTIPKGSVSPVIDQGDGNYQFRVTPSTDGIYSVTVAVDASSITRKVVVAADQGPIVGQPLEVHGNVNTAGDEDGITITPDGSYLFIQYAPIYFSGLANISSICQASCTDPGNPACYAMYDLVNCAGKPDSSWVFDLIGPVNTSTRPNFPMGGISNRRLNHSSIQIPGVVNGLAIWPSVFYGFKRQANGNFTQPFKVAFNDPKGAQGPFGLSFKMTGANKAQFAVAYDNYFNNLGDDGADIYTGTMTLGQENSLGTVTYSGEYYSSITPLITPVSFASHAGNQGNPHLYADSSGAIKSIWVDDEKASHDLRVYLLTAGSYPSGTWTPMNLASKINTAASESQPFFSGTHLYLNRDARIVRYRYLGNTHNDYDQDAKWGDEEIVLQGNPAGGVNTIFGFGEPTLATYDGKTYLYFVYVWKRGRNAVTGRYDLDLDAGFVEIQ